ncbi:MAG: TIM barrel protein [Armatimonadetes bacterium]|nr:TIM barrel protein [Armatimonadota bacterium]
MKKFSLGIGMFQQWFKAYPSLDFINKLRNYGIEFVEFLVNLEDWELRSRQINMILKEDFRITLHLAFDGDYNSAFFKEDETNKTFQIYKELFNKINTITFKESLLINLHAAILSHPAKKEELFKIKINFLSLLYKKKEKNNWNFNFAAELLPFDSKKEKVGETTEDLLRLSQEIKQDNFGFCWDLGHFHANYLAGRNGKITKSFLEKVKHIHLHDFKEKDDHFPLIFNQVPYRKYLNLIPNQATLALEINYKNASQVGDPLFLLFKSIENLKDNPH